MIGFVMRLLCLVCALAFFASQDTAWKTRVEVFWIPWTVETYAPVTPENIEKEALKIIRIRDEEQTDHVLGLIMKSDQKVDSKRIRVKIKTESKFYNFDSDGIGVSSIGEAVKIDLKKLKSALCE
ncbi:MAG TPA: hypothetical protein VLY23_08340 [Candidatus Acidoferrum sp.]|nr:hypothetical protein [Candidatus Acidoferrum sp.]